MKIVISRMFCFELPIKVIKRYFELIEVKPYFYERRTDRSTSPSFDKYTLTDTPNDDKDICIVTKYFGKTCTDDEIYSDANFNERDLERNDINLVKSVEEINPKNLKVVEIPDDVKWYIHESEVGTETIHEEHRTWY